MIATMKNVIFIARLTKTSTKMTKVNIAKSLQSASHFYKCFLKTLWKRKWRNFDIFARNSEFIFEFFMNKLILLNQINENGSKNEKRALMHYSYCPRTFFHLQWKRTLPRIMSVRMFVQTISGTFEFFTNKGGSTLQQHLRKKFFGIFAIMNFLGVIYFNYTHKLEHKTY